MKHTVVDASPPAAVTAAVVQAVRRWPAEDREAFFDALRAAFCLHCGGDQPEGSRGCQCWNDE